MLDKQDNAAAQPKIENVEDNESGSPLNTGGKRGADRQLADSKEETNHRNGDVKGEENTSENIPASAEAKKPSKEDDARQTQSFNGNNDPGANATHPNID